MNDKLKEKVADKMHEAWSGWMAYIFRKSKVNPDGTITIPQWAVKRWSKQVDTWYKDLPENMKDSDREEADKILALPEIKSALDKLEMLKITKEIFEIQRELKSLPALPDIELIVDCPECKYSSGKSTGLAHRTQCWNKCKSCKGTGQITQKVTLDEFIEAVTEYMRNNDIPFKGGVLRLEGEILK
ncbi:hypothetical protein LCGC14_0359230 [marine sediment metagenome]|uniref:Uncharacterized protein n=1 Tax=marine sediment metagenome TaxID=412755 RepID=A0A0F9WGL8_9ZZZZ